MPQLPLYDSEGARDASLTVERQLRNVFVDKLAEGDEWVVKRPGLTRDIQPAGAAGVSRGSYYWDGNLYTVIGGTVYKGTTSLGTITGTTGKVYWALMDTDPRVLVVQTGGTCWTIQDDDTLTEITDADYPTGVVGSVVYMNGYIYVINSKGEIYNSDNGDETAWTSGNFLTAEAVSDDGVSIIRYKDYIVAFGEYSTQFFYDAANSSGSPLNKYTGAVSLIGCAEAATITVADDTVCFVGQMITGGRFIAKIEGMEPKQASPYYINRLLDAEGSALSSSSGYHIRIGGHSFYIVNLTSQEISIVYDMDSKQWSVWTLYDGSSEEYFKFVESVADDADDVFLLHESDGYYYKMSESVYQDNSQDIKVSGTTALYAGESLANKFMSRLEIIGDRTSSSATLNLSWTDDDYNTFSTARGIDLSGRNPLTRLGRFTRRGFRYTFEENAPMRLKALDLAISGGSYGQ